MKTFRDYINLIENAEQGVAEGSEPDAIARIEQLASKK